MDSDVLGYYLGGPAIVSDAMANNDYLNSGGASGATAACGRAGLSILSLGVLGVMFFYIATRSRQF